MQRKEQQRAQDDAKSDPDGQTNENSERTNDMTTISMFK